MSLQILIGDCRETLKTLPDESVHCVVTSPPYWGLRAYLAGEHADKGRELGTEATYPEYVEKVVSVFREVRRVLRADGTLWLNLGDCHATGAGSARKAGGKCFGKQNEAVDSGAFPMSQPNRMPQQGLKPKDLVGIPWRVAFALQSDGWYLRQWMPWIKRNPMPESTKDRPVVSCETFFLLSKSQSYFYDFEAVQLPGSMALAEQVEQGYDGKATKDFAANGVQNASDVKSRIIAGKRKSDKQRGHSRRHDGFNDRWDEMEKQEQCSGWRSTRNSDWFFESLAPMLLNEDAMPLAMVVNPTGYKGAHFATFPPALVKPCILAGTRPGDTVLDPFGGSGTTGQVALEFGRRAILCELNPAYEPLIRARCAVTPGLPLA